MNASHIDIGIGILTSDGGCGPQCPWADGYQFSQYGPGKIYTNGVQQAENIIKQFGTPSSPVYIVGIAPLVNLGQMFVDNPDYKKSVRFITMGGGIFPSKSEYNIHTNVSSSEIVYNYTNKIPYAASTCAAPLELSAIYQISVHFSDKLSYNLPKVQQDNIKFMVVIIKNFMMHNHGM